MTTQRPASGERLTGGLLYRFVSNAAGKWDPAGRPTPAAFDPQPRTNDNGISFFRQDLLHHDPDVAAQMVLDGLTDYGLIEVEVARFFARCEEIRATEIEHQRIEDLQRVIVYYDPNEFRCGAAHYYLVEETDTEPLHSYIKDVLCEVAVTRVPAKGRKGGKRATPPSPAAPGAPAPAPRRL